MNSDQFKNLKDGDIVRHVRSGYGFHVVNKIGDSFTLLRTGTLDATSAVSFEVVSNLTPYVAPAPPAPPAPVHPSDDIMLENLFAAGWARVQNAHGVCYQSPAGATCYDLRACWEGLPKAGPVASKPYVDRASLALNTRMSRLTAMRTELLANGWRRSGVHGVVWIHLASGLNVRSTIRAHTLFKQGVPGPIQMVWELREAGFTDNYAGSCQGVWFTRDRVRAGSLVTAWGDLKGAMR